ncbi:hypothetical protein D0869_15632 [Hortaea werneckii]|uniref:Uncharacterized protein n=2 Tax=Hortaea werneckii TaxID=91943 RepID=A0A3M6YR77_HORWE|nr:hypothetical protein D0869_15632 [Hortaea werneckii]RMX94587.1 hypothetical protein D0868_12218 [Hortaea werneckii]RMY05550.1 hypothetical protein D0867_09988 [Hortaea werneckii]
MGLKNYFKASKPAQPAQQNATPTVVEPEIDEKAPPRPPFASAGGSGYGTPSRPGSIAPSHRSTYMDEIKHEVMVNYLFQQQCGIMWIGDGSGETEGVLMRRAKASYLACPPDLIHSTFAAGIMALNAPVAMTINSRVVKTYLSWTPNAVDVPLKNGTRVQVLSTMHDLPKARKAQSCAFVASEGLLVVWDDDAKNLIPHGQAIESELMDLVWRTGDQGLEEEEAENEKAVKPPRVTAEEIDEESGEYKPEVRATHLQNTVLVAITLCLVTVLLGLGWRSIASEIQGDGNYIRIAFVLLTPIQIFFSMFFCQVVVGCIAQLVGPIKQMKGNSRFYSGMLPRRLNTPVLPHVTIQCPVYKEGLVGVIQPTVRSLKKAIATYELQGGTANIFYNDDGLQLISEEERQARIDFYADHSIGWTARPKHNSDGFIRRGKFKKASNMNYGLNLSNCVEEKLLQVNRHDGWTQNDEAAEYERCLREVLEDNPRAWADGNIRIGDYILLIDSDTRVPEDCLLDCVSEMEQSPEVGIMQFSSGVMQVVGDFFENGITFFTNLIYTAIRYTVSNGDVAPFVGHNAIVRWSAIQQIGSFDGLDDYEKFWSEAHVSEDFEMSLKLQCEGYIIRLAAWAGEGFKEGVSLTVYDELARWEKYAYGCNELLFHPIRTWLWRGPFTPLFRKFLFSNIRLTSKITIISYIGTYYAIGAAWIMTVANYFAIGWYNGYLDKYYIDSWKVWFSIVIVFNGLGNFGLATMRYRIGERNWFASLIENFKWTPMFAIFLGGLSLHVSQAILSHMFEIDMSWGSTSKEAEQTNFWKEIPKTFNAFKYSIGFATFFIIVMIILATGNFIPYSWNIGSFIAILPLSTVCASHLLLPFVLNPGMMQFTF